MRRMAIGLVASSLLAALTGAHASGLGHHIERAVDGSSAARVRRLFDDNSTAETRTILTDSASGAVMQLGHAGGFSDHAAIRIGLPQTIADVSIAADNRAARRRALEPTINRAAEQAIAQMGPIMREAINELTRVDPGARYANAAFGTEHLRMHAGERTRAGLHGIVAR